MLKDINWVRRQREIQLGPEKASLLSEQLRRDTEFLKRNHIMDYSLLIGIHRMERGNRDGLRQSTLQVFDVSLARYQVALKGMASLMLLLTTNHLLSLFSLLIA